MTGDEKTKEANIRKEALALFDQMEQTIPTEIPSSDDIDSDKPLPTMPGRPTWTDDEFLYVMKGLVGRKIPVKTLTGYLPYVFELTTEGKIKLMPGGLRERLLGLGFKISFKQLENVRTNEIYVVFTLIEISEAERLTFIENKRLRNQRSRANRAGALKQIQCGKCRGKVRVGMFDGEVRLFCEGCMTSPSDAINVTSVIPKDILEHWR